MVLRAWAWILHPDNVKFVQTSMNVIPIMADVFPIPYALILLVHSNVDSASEVLLATKKSDVPIGLAYVQMEPFVMRMQNASYLQD